MPLLVEQPPSFILLIIGVVLPRLRTRCILLLVFEAMINNILRAGRNLHL